MRAMVRAATPAPIVMPRATFRQVFMLDSLVHCRSGAVIVAVVELSLPGVQVVTGAASQQRRTTAGNKPRDRTAVRHGRGNGSVAVATGGAPGWRDRRGFERHREFLSLTTTNIEWKRAPVPCQAP